MRIQRAFFYGMFLTGIILGAIVINFFYNIQWKNVFDDILLNYDQSFLTTDQQQIYTLRLCMLRVFFLDFLWVACFLKHGMLLVLAELFGYGIWLGGMIALCTIIYGAFGLYYAFAYCMPHFIFYAIAISMVCDGCVKQNLSSENEISGRLVLSHVILLLGVFSEGYVHPLLLQRL